MKKIFAIIFLLFACIGAINFLTVLFLHIDFCFFTFSKVTELSSSTCIILGVATILSGELGLMIASTIDTE